MIKKIGIIGGGQLGRMLAMDAKKMGFYVAVIDPTPESPAGQVVDYQIVADYKDEKAIKKLAEMVDVITFEIELANDKVLYELIKAGKKVHPHPKTLGIIRDKFLQKKFLKKHKIPIADFFEIKDLKEISTAEKIFGYPFLLKAKTDAYDGRGNALIKNKKDIIQGIKKLEGRSLYVEKFVPFVKELAVIVARSNKGEIKVYPVVETIHRNNICHMVIAPADIDKKIEGKAKALAKKVMEELGGAGVFAIEMFLTKNEKVFINEIAPRVHNSGHYTIEGVRTSQFEQHIRAITGLPLGPVDMLFPSAVMINILGERNAEVDVKGLEKVLKIPQVKVHIYGKKDTKKERKMGHITATGDIMAKTMSNAKKAHQLISI